MQKQGTQRWRVDLAMCHQDPPARNQKRQLAPEDVRKEDTTGLKFLSKDLVFIISGLPHLGA